MVERSAVQRIRELDRERAQIFDQAKEEALEKANEAVAALNALGLNFRLVDGEQQIRKGKAPGKAPVSTKGAVRDAPCSICGSKPLLRTTPGLIAARRRRRPLMPQS